MLANIMALCSCGGGGSGSAADSAPVAANGSLSAVMGATTSGSLSARGSAPLSYAISTPPQDGTLNVSDASTGAFTYTSYPNFTGTDTFQFTAKNSVGASSPATETITVTSGAIGASQAVANVGVSIDWLCYWCTAQPFVDMMRQAAFFTDPTTGTPLIEEGKLDQDGWPEADAQIMVACCTKQDAGSAADPGPTNPLIGKYQLSFNGIATIWDDGGTVENQQYDAATNTTTATLDQTPLGSGGTGFNMLLKFTKTQRTTSTPVGSGFTNLHILRPQFAPNGAKWWDSPTQEFTDPFLASLKGFSTVRYIDWSNVINSPEINWSDRTPGNWPISHHLMLPPSSSLTYLSGSGNNGWYSTGASWESAIDIANATHTDMWINIPAMATDDYVTNLAQLIKSKLDPGLHVYVEWSDEIWNYANPFWTETNYNADQTTALLASSPTEQANYTAHCAKWAWNECHVAEHVMQFRNDFASVYGQSAINATIRPLLCTQVVQPSYMQEALGFIAAVYGPPSNYFYGICGAPYWSVSSTLPAGTTATGAVAALDQAIPSNDPYLQTDAATALYYGLNNLTYEGGPSNVTFAVAGDTSGQAAAALETAVQLAPGMKADVTQGLTRAFADGVDMYMYYENESATLWGATIDPLDLEAPKFAGLTAVTGQMITRNAGTTLPGSIPANPPVFGVLADSTVRPFFETTGWYFSAAGTTPAYTAENGSSPPGTGLGYLVNVPAAGSYSVSLVMDSKNGTSANSIELDVDRKTIGNFTVPQSPAGTSLTVGPLPVTLTTGLHVIEIKYESGKGFAIESINVTNN